MKKSRMLIALAAVALTGSLLACSGNNSQEQQDVSMQFAKSFAEKLSNNDIDSILAVYPSAELCDSFSLQYDEDSLKVVAGDAPDTYKVGFGNGVVMEMKKNADGSFTVTSSHGLFACSKETLDLARKTGMLDDTPDDVTLASRLADKDFKPWLVKRFTREFAKTLMVKGGIQVVKEGEFANAEWIFGYTVVNSSDQPVLGQDYKVVFKVHNVREDTYSDSSEPGKDIAPNSSVLITTSGTEYYEPADKAYVSIKLSDEQLFEKYFKAKGDEYTAYNEEKKS